MERTKNGYRLSSGREFYAHCGFVSLMPDDREDDGWKIGEGDVGRVDVFGILADNGMTWIEPPWTAVERGELADHMIALWQAFKDGSGGRDGSA